MLLRKSGKGYKIAEKDPIKYHGVTPFNIKTGVSDGKIIYNFDLHEYF